MKNVSNYKISNLLKYSFILMLKSIIFISCQDNDDAPYLPNDEYPLPQKQFRLYYTSESQESHAFSIWIMDSFDNEKKIDFEFDNIL